MRYKGHRKIDGMKRTLDRNHNRKSSGAHWEIFGDTGQEFEHFHGMIAYRNGQQLL